MLPSGKGSLSLCPSSHLLQVKHEEGVWGLGARGKWVILHSMIFLLKSVYWDCFSFLWAYFSSSFIQQSFLLFNSVGVKSEVFIITLSCLAQLDSFTEERDQSSSFPLTCWLWIRDTYKISWVVYFGWCYCCGFIIYFAVLYISYYVLLSPFFLLSSYNVWHWKWNHRCCHFWLQRTKS